MMTMFKKGMRVALIRTDIDDRIRGLVVGDKGFVIAQTSSGLLLIDFDNLTNYYFMEPDQVKGIYK